MLGEPFFERHGPKAVFFGRFLLGLRVWASWLAGAVRMHWRSFVLWNALGGICWATGIGLFAYFLGSAAGNAVGTFGLYGLVAVAIAAVSVFIAHRRLKRHLNQQLEDQAPPAHPAVSTAEPAAGTQAPAATPPEGASRS